MFFQPGAAAGYHYIFRVDKAALLSPKTWIFALGQAFFSLSVAGNGTLIYGSYLSDEEDLSLIHIFRSIIVINYLESANSSRATTRLGA